MFPRHKSSNLVTGCGWQWRRIVSMAAIKKHHTHTPVTGEAWWMIISRCDRCCIRGGLSLSVPFCAPPLCLPLRLLAYLGQSFNIALTQLYWHTPDSVWWLMNIWVPLSPLLFICSLFVEHYKVKVLIAHYGNFMAIFQGNIKIYDVGFKLICYWRHYINFCCCLNWCIFQLI